MYYFRRRRSFATHQLSRVKHSFRSASVCPFKPDSPGIAGPGLRPALGLFGVLVVAARFQRKGHHQRFDSGAASCAAGRAFVMVLSCCNNSW